MNMLNLDRIPDLVAGSRVEIVSEGPLCQRKGTIVEVVVRDRMFPHFKVFIRGLGVLGFSGEELEVYTSKLGVKREKGS